MSTRESEPKPRILDRIIGPSPREQYLDLQLSAVEKTLSNISLKMENLDISAASGERTSMHEALTNIDLMLDAQGWTNVFEYDDDAGLSLRQIKEASRQVRELVVGNPIVGNGARIRAGNTWGGGVEFAARNRRGKQDPKPLPVDIQILLESTWAQRYFFGNKAHSQLERAAFTDGMLFALGRDSDGRLQRVQIHEITGALMNPNNSEEVWAYRRTWSVKNVGSENPEERTRWYYTDIFPREERRRRIRFNGQDEVAEVGYTMLDFAFNKQIGWSFGVPDALCIVAWARLYKEFLVNGYVMSRSLAKLAYKITVSSTNAGNNAATTVAAPGQAGSTHIEGAGNSLTPLATAGRGYDFASGNSLAGPMAAGLGVSLLALLSNPAAATGSNAAAQSLDPIARATAAVRRREWEDDFKRIFQYWGMDRQLVTTWRDLPTDTMARLMQAWTLVDQGEWFEGDVVQREVARTMGIPNPGPLPSDWKPKSQRSAGNSTFGQTGTSPADGRGTDDGSGDSQDDHDDDED